VALGDAGDDMVVGDRGSDLVDGGTGNDRLQSMQNEDQCLGPDTVGPDTLIGGSGKDAVGIRCGVPTLKLRDGEADTGICKDTVTSAVKEFDKADKFEGGPCASLVCKKKGKKKKGKKSSVSTAASTAKKGKKKKKCKPFKFPKKNKFPNKPKSSSALSLGVGLTLTRP
jgi:hypothetical protein